MKIHGVNIAIIAHHHNICSELAHFIVNHDVDIVMVHEKVQQVFEPEPIPFKRLQIPKIEWMPESVNDIQPHKFFDKPRNNWKKR